MVTEYLSGGTLVEFIRQNCMKMEEYIIDIVSDVLEALDYLKKNKIMHRDLKPENIVQRKEDKKWVLVDFGLAAYSNQTYLYDKCGTLGYMAPEVEDQSNSTKPYN
jgi:serine/threonine protein kinase